MALLLVTGCDENDGGATDYGPYSTELSEDDSERQPSRSRGILTESLRLGERIVYATDIDPELSAGRGAQSIVDYQGMTDGILAGAQKSALHDYRVLAGFGAVASNKSQVADGEPQKLLLISILAFADEQTATAAARDMERKDFEFSTDNVQVTLDAHPSSLNHWRPGVPSVGSWMPWKTLVIRVLAVLPEPDLARLTDMVTDTLRRQLAALETFIPTPESELASLRQDPDHLLTRLVETGDRVPEDHEYAVYGLHTFSLLLDSPAADFQERARRGVTTIAVSHNKFLYRFRDDATATDFSDYLVGLTEDAEYVRMRGVANHATITCSQATVMSQLWVEASRYRCVIRRDEFVAFVSSNVDTDVRRLAAAQYALLGDRP